MLALSLRERHGYEIIQQVQVDSGGRVRLGPGALYASLHKLTRDGLVAEVEGDGNERRRYYRITPEGLTRLGAELAFYEYSVHISKQRLTGEAGV